MKKFIILMLAIAFTVFGTVSSASAQAVFNSPGEMPTVTVSNASTNPCNMGPIDGCWKTSTTARPGDIIAVHVYYRNTSNTPSNPTAISIQPGNIGVTSSVTYRGGVSSQDGRAVGYATVSLTESAPVSYISGSARWYPSANSGGRSVDENGLFGSTGFVIGTVYPGEQGVLVANFRVGQGHNDVPDDECRIDSFTADDYTIEEGDSTDLNWRTTDCERAEIYPTLGRVALDGSEPVRPHDDTKYTLTAYDSNGHSVSRNLTIRVEEQEEEDKCSIDSFTADDYSIRRGDSVSLRWRTTGADSVDIEPVSNNRSADGSLNVSPSSTTTYTLRADCNRGSDKSRSLTITVEKEPVIIKQPPVVYNPPQVIIQPPRVITNRVVVTKSAPSALELKIATEEECACFNAVTKYTVSYKNISKVKMKNAVLQFTHPREMTFVSSSRGDYEKIDRTVTVDLGDLLPGETGTVTVKTRLNDEGVVGNLTVTTAKVVYTNGSTGAQEDAIAYSLLTVADDCPNADSNSGKLSANVIGFGSFLPDTLIEWLLLILIILALIVLTRQLSKKKE